VEARNDEQFIVRDYKKQRVGKPAHEGAADVLIDKGKQPGIVAYTLH
jgi:hypothetical protein